MTDRFNGLLVTLDHDIRKDDAEHIIGAIMQLRGVAGCNGNVANIETHLAEVRVKNELWREVRKAFFPE